ncbi:MAG: hypothetical protein CMO06_20285 [Thalassospira sp.]|uniref:hypothetical protein n=1 Tax=Thalassospira sp. TaxID=1912094 RepID=UPI000C3B7DEE|nr:hypothetical protein [Thalassospira sp.]MAZ35484.1 hypothetical protein [Thalassospira sp.]
MRKKFFDINDMSENPDRSLPVTLLRLVVGLLVACIVLLVTLSAASAQNPNFVASKKANEIPVFNAVYPEDEFCATTGVGGLCAAMPVDVPEFDANFIYRFVAYEAQRPFDRFSWQSFVSLLWPHDNAGAPIATGYRQPDAGHGLWESYATKNDVFGDVAKANASCRAGLPDGHLLLSAFIQSSGDILIDQAGNFILYDTRINDVAADYIRWNGLGTAQGRLTFAQSGQSVEFPMLTLSAGGKVADNSELLASDKTWLTPGAQLTKFAWRIITSPANQDRYYTRPARIALAADDTLDGVARCLDVTVGLVGLHIVQRVKSGNGDRWIWSSFEHADNAPLADNARRPNSIIANDLFPDGCLAPEKTDRDYIFYGGGAQGDQQGGKTDRAANGIIRSDLRWADQPPYARDPDGNRVAAPDIVRCWRLFSGTAEANFVWQRKLEGSVLQNYFLLGTQWIGNGGGAPFGVGEIPRFLTNTALESFIQHQADGTCLGCHATAFTDAGQPANFTFLLDPGR